MTRKTNSSAVTVTSVTDGVASLKEYRLQLEHDGVILLSEMFDTATPSADVVSFLFIRALHLCMHWYGPRVNRISALVNGV